MTLPTPTDALSGSAPSVFWDLSKLSARDICQWCVSEQFGICGLLGVGTHADRDQYRDT